MKKLLELLEKEIIKCGTPPTPSKWKKLRCQIREAVLPVVVPAVEDEPTIVVVSDIEDGEELVIVPNLDAPVTESVEIYDDGEETYKVPVKTTVYNDGEGDYEVEV
jgi:hypothetical protein